MTTVADRLRRIGLAVWFSSKICFLESACRRPAGRVWLGKRPSPYTLSIGAGATNANEAWPLGLVSVGNAKESEASAPRGWSTGGRAGRAAGRGLRFAGCIVTPPRTMGRPSLARWPAGHIAVHHNVINHPPDLAFVE